MNAFNKILAFVVGGLIFSFLGYMAASLALGAFLDEPPGWLMLALLVVAALMTYKAPTAGKAWRRLLICSAIFTLLLPISTLIMSVAGVNEAALAGGEHSGAAAAGAMLGGGMATIFTGVISFFLAAVFLVIGLLVGKDQPARTT